MFAMALARRSLPIQNELNHTGFWHWVPYMEHGYQELCLLGSRRTFASVVLLLPPWGRSYSFHRYWVSLSTIPNHFRWFEAVLDMCSPRDYILRYCLDHKQPAPSAVGCQRLDCSLQQLQQPQDEVQRRPMPASPQSSSLTLQLDCRSSFVSCDLAE